MKTDISIEIIKEVLKNTPYNNYDIINVQEGVSTDVFKLTNSDTYYLKVQPEEDSLPAIHLANKLLLDLGVSISEIEYVGDKNETLNDRTFSIEKEVKGKSLKMDNTLSKEQKERVTFQAGKDLAKINSIPVEGVGWIIGVENGKILANGNNYNDFILNRIDNMLNELLNNNILLNTQTEKIKEYINTHLDLLDIKNTSYLAHGDFSIDHIYSSDGEYSGIIDFGDIRGTSRYHDLAHFYTFNREYFKSLIEGYNSVYELPKDYMNRIKVEAILFGVSKLWWIAENRSEKLENHPTLKLFEEIVY